MTTKWTTPAEIAKEFGLSAGSIRRMASGGQFPEGSVMKIGTALRLDRDAIVQSFLVTAPKK